MINYEFKMKSLGEFCDNVYLVNCPLIRNSVKAGTGKVTIQFSSHQFTLFDNSVFFGTRYPLDVQIHISKIIKLATKHVNKNVNDLANIRL